MIYFSSHSDTFKTKEGDDEVRRLNAKYEAYISVSKVLLGAGIFFLLLFAGWNLAFQKSGQNQENYHQTRSFDQHT